MLRRFRSLTSFATAGVLLAACGGSDTTTEATVPPQTAVPETSAVAETTAVPETTAAPDAVGIDGRLAEALSASVDVESFRTFVSQGEVYRIDALGVDSSSLIDPERPSLVVERDASGSTSVVLDVGAQFEVTNPALADLGEILLRSWTTPDFVYFDTTGYQPLEDANPGSLGVFSPGVFSVDLGRVEGAAGDDVVRVLVGTTSPDLGTVATILIDALDSARALPDDSGSYVGTAVYSDLIEVQGLSAADSAASISAGLAPALGVDAQTLADYYEEFYRSASVEVVVTVGDTGVLESVAYDADLSAIFDGLVDVMRTGALLDGASAADIAELQAAYDEAEYRVATSIVYEPDDSIVVEPPTGEIEDRTDAMVTFFEQSGIDFSE